jgi:hypothetical protein
MRDCRSVKRGLAGKTAAKRKQKKAAMQKLTLTNPCSGNQKADPVRKG